MLHIGCPTNSSLADRPPDLARYKITLGRLPHKADINIQSHRITVDVDYWNRLSDDGKKLLLFHEVAHLQNSGCAKSCDNKPQGCERCADNRAGACLAMVGFSPSRMRLAVKEMNMSRQSFAGDVNAGFFAAFRGLNGTQFTQAPLTPPKNHSISIGLPGSHLVSSSELSLTSSSSPAVKSPPSNITTPPLTPPTTPNPSNSPAVSDDSAPTQCACKTPSQNWEWIVGVAGGLFAGGLILAKVLR